MNDELSQEEIARDKKREAELQMLKDNPDMINVGLVSEFPEVVAKAKEILEKI